MKRDYFYKSKRAIDLVVYISVLLEIIFFLSFENIVGCVMVVSSWLIYRNIFLKRSIVVLHPFSFLAYTSFFLGHFLCLPATLLEFKPVSYGFQNSFETFFYETLMFLTLSLAFFVFIKRNIDASKGFIREKLASLGFFRSDDVLLWMFGVVGITSRLLQLSVANDTEYGDVQSKFVEGLMYLQYAPILLLFPTLLNDRRIKTNRWAVFFYVIVVFILSLATNSRQAMMIPLFTIFLLFFLKIVNDGIPLNKLISPIRLFCYSVVAYIFLSLFSNISIAMLGNRSIRGDISRSELFNKTIETLGNKDIMEDLKKTSTKDNLTLVRYSDGWNENYLNNFMLNRYGNLRISDQAIYHANRVGFGNKLILESYFKLVVGLLPTPVLKFFGLNVNKEDLYYSPGDMLYATSSGVSTAFGGYRVTSLVADGLATFSFFCFPIAFVLVYIVFLLLDSLVIKTVHGILYSPLGLINIFVFLGLLRNSISMFVPTGYILRGFWQLCFTYFTVLLLILFIKRLFKA